MFGDKYHENIEDKMVLAIVADPCHPDLPAVASFWSIAFYVEGHRLSLSTDQDTDEMKITVEAAALPDDAPELHWSLQELIGSPLGRFWGATNSQGYFDMLILAFGEGIAGASPQMAFLVEASSIHIHRLVPA